MRALAALLLAAPVAAAPAIPPGEWETRSRARSFAATELLPKGVAEEATARTVVRRHCLDAADTARSPARVFVAAYPGCRVASESSTATGFAVAVACRDGRQGSMTGTVGPRGYAAKSEFTSPRGMKTVVDIAARRLGNCTKPLPPAPPAAPAAKPGAEPPATEKPAA